MPNSILPSPIKKTSSFVAGSELPFYYQFISTSIREIYFSKVSLIYHNRSQSENTHPKLILCSHRNSAFDGYIALKAFPKAQALASIQLLNSCIMKTFFTGIPVVRKKDRQRLGINTNIFSSPSEAAIAHIKAGGDLLLFPEGSSEWGFQPLPYQRGAARIIRTLISEGVDFDIIPMGLFYIAPDKFSSKVEVYIGDNICITSKKDNLSIREWEQNIHKEVSNALNKISVNCPDVDIFEKASSYAFNKNKEGYSYAESFIDYQNNLSQADNSNKTIEKTSQSSILIWRYISFLFMYILFPILLSSFIASHFADARNTVSFFKILGGAIASAIWLPILVMLLFFSPLFIGISLVSASFGFILIRKKGAQIC
ncbi:glycerol acyltransferase [Proteus vulgaris]|uniref:glycerol acyltransferase n=1 Tax=Proteus TaxID=583 RepID=UPI001412ED30|nr:MULTISPECIES: glycerol acyltransferase [Proteus]NBM56588.1 glycerol acyltransferase [Proteus sp. G2669]UDN38026.1 glycerol acyltransferase [Proteus sp. NMG38-2]UPK79361.1 glycerol acyltransferase [Proteus vulgaris]